MEKSDFETKYRNATGELPLRALKFFIEDLAQVMGKTKMYADAQQLAETLQELGLDAWASFDDLTAEDLVDAGMRPLDARAILRQVLLLRATQVSEEEGPGDDVADSGVTSAGGASRGANPSEATNATSGVSQDYLQVSELTTGGEEADEEVEIGPSDGPPSKLSKATEVSQGQSTATEDDYVVPGGAQPSHIARWYSRRRRQQQ